MSEDLKTIKELADELGVSKSYVDKIIRILKLHTKLDKVGNKYVISKKQEKSIITRIENSKSTTETHTESTTQSHTKVDAEVDFLKEEISSDMKGFLLLLKCLGINGSNTVLYSLDKIGKQKLLHVGLNKIKELTRLGISLQVISKAKTGYVITDKFIYEDLPEQKADSPTEQLLVDYYNRIVSYCKRQEMKPPKYDKELMKIIFNNCPNFEFFVDKMNNRNYPKEKISNLMYFIKTLNFDIPESNEKAKDDCIIMT